MQVKLRPIPIIAAAIMFMSQVGPKGIRSNLSEWWESFTGQEAPEWMTGPKFDRIVFYLALVTIIVWASWAFWGRIEPYASAGRRWAYRKIGYIDGKWRWRLRVPWELVDQQPKPRPPPSPPPPENGFRTVPKNAIVYVPEPTTVEYYGEKEGILGSVWLNWDAHMQSLTADGKKGLASFAVEETAGILRSFTGTYKATAKFPDSPGPFTVAIDNGPFANRLILGVGGLGGKINENTKDTVSWFLSPSLEKSTRRRVFFYKKTSAD